MVTLVLASGAHVLLTRRSVQTRGPQCGSKFLGTYGRRPVQSTELLGPDSLLRKMSAGLSAGATSPEDIGGRPAWSVRLTGSCGGAVVLAFDDSTGVLVRVANDRGEVLLGVENLAEPEVLPDALFVWDGPIRPAPSPRDRRRHTADDDTERLGTCGPWSLRRLDLTWFLLLSPPPPARLLPGRP